MPEGYITCRRHISPVPQRTDIIAKGSLSAAFCMVEARRVELLSKNPSAALSTSVAGYLKDSLRPPPVRQAAESGSFIFHDALKALRVHVHRSMTPVRKPRYSPGGRLPSVRQRSQIRYSRLLFFAGIKVRPQHCSLIRVPNPCRNRCAPVGSTL